jgi:hypothetical protein
MAHIFKYAILTAIPDPRRGERVNVGIVVLLKDRIDVKFAGLSKVSALTGGEWNSYASDVEKRLISRFKSGEQAEESIRSHPQLDPIFHASDIALMSVRSLSDYDTRIKEILASLVIRPRSQSEQKVTRINTQISRQLRLVKVLAGPDETIDSRKVIRDFPISPAKGLVADFALKNGAWHIMATLDLRKSHVRIDEAALKAITLNKARAVYRDEAKLIGVYAAPDGVQEVKPSVALLKDYADKAYNWMNDKDRKAFIGAIRKAASPPFKFGVGRMRLR